MPSLLTNNKQKSNATVGVEMICLQQLCIIPVADKYFIPILGVLSGNLVRCSLRLAAECASKASLSWALLVMAIEGDFRPHFGTQRHPQRPSLESGLKILVIFACPKH